jgi:hypothetical protein
LASLSNNEYLDFTLFDDSDYQMTKKGRKIFNRISLFFIDKNSNSNNPAHYEFLFTHNEISDVFHETIVKWYDLKESLSPIRHHLIESVKTKKFFTSLDFLIIVQALEGYHRRFVSPKGTLEDRLSQLVDKFRQIRKIKLSSEDIEHTVKSRHYYSHFYDKETTVLEGVELYRLTQQLRILLVCCVLFLIGFDLAVIDKLVNKNSTI